MTTNPCNCSTCPYLIPFNPDHERELHQCSHPLIEKSDNLTKYLGVDEYCRTFVLGCLSHPGAREYLMKDVIAELNKREHCLGMYRSVKEEGKIEGYNEALSLIRDGVK